MRFLRSLFSSRTLTGLLAVTLLTGLLAGIRVQAETTQQIYGTVQTAQGTPVSGVTVYATAPGDSVAAYGPVATDVDGTYSFAVAYKTAYDIHFEPDGTSNLQNYTQANLYVYRSDVLLDVSLPSAVYYTFDGTVLDDSDGPVEGITVKASSATSGEQTVATDSNGTFSMQLSSDIYTVSLAKDTVGTAPAYPYFELSQDDVDLTSDNASSVYHLPEPGTATITAYDRFSALAADQPVTFAGDNTQSYETTTDIDGVAHVPFLRTSGVTEGALCITFSQTAAVVCNTDAYDGTDDIALSLSEPVKMTLSGTVTDSEGEPVPDVHVILTSQSDSTLYDTTSDSDGSYMLSVEPAQYSAVVSTKESSYTTKKHWSAFAIDQGIVDLTSDDAQDFVLPALRTLHIDVTGHNSTSLRVDVDPDDSYIQSALNNAGSADFITYDGQILPAGSVCATYEASNAGSVCNPETITVADQNVTYAFAAPEMYKFSGQLLNVDGTPAKNRGARLLLNDVITATAVGKTATFSISLTPGTYTVHALANGGVDEDMGTIDIVDTDINQNYQFSQ